MSWYIPLAVTFTAIFLAELGDKTQLITISLSSKYSHVPVFFGVFLGMGVVTIIGVFIGTVLFEVVEIMYVKILSGLIFIIFGIWTLFSMVKGKEEGEGKDEVAVKTEEKSIFSTAFIMTSLAEFGDKTQFAVIALTAQYASPVLVYAGAMMAFALIIGIGVVLGKKIAEKVSSKWIELCSGVLFIVIGVLFLIEAAFL
ncbi:MAG: TMEM165/GDT1 family protein [Thermoplasmata archaeon]|nr:MAG: TMEM165/GDT1 family protein [Thermoplasmata archaeon]